MATTWHTKKAPPGHVMVLVDWDGRICAGFYVENQDVFNVVYLDEWHYLSNTFVPSQDIAGWTEMPERQAKPVKESENA